MCVCVDVVGLCLQYFTLQFGFNGRKVVVKEWPTLVNDLCLMNTRERSLSLQVPRCDKICIFIYFFPSSPCKYLFYFSVNRISASATPEINKTGHIWAKST